MKNQVSIQPYEQRMPTMPSGAVPIEGRLQTLTAQQSALTTNPLPATPVNRKNGGIYYGYYCLMCHGVKGDGNGPVGQSYVPKPTDLSSPAVTSMNDGQIYGAMLNGVGHSPVLAQTVLPEHRWPLVMYVRTFSGR
jgi:mono/diheme cytochrome c family protein